MTTIEDLLEALRQVVALRDKMKAKLEEFERAGGGLSDEATVEMTAMEVAICVGALDKTLEGL